DIFVGDEQHDIVMEEERLITELLSKYFTYCNNQDIENWRKLFTKHTKFITWSGVMYASNAENIEQHDKAHQMLSKQNQNMKYHLDVLDISLIRDDIAIVYVAWKWEDFKIDNLHTELRTGILTMLLLKEDGVWLIRSTQNTRTSENLR